MISIQKSFDTISDVRLNERRAHCQKMYMFQQNLTRERSGAIFEKKLKHGNSTLGHCIFYRSDTGLLETLSLITKFDDRALPSGILVKIIYVSESTIKEILLCREHT